VHAPSSLAAALADLGGLRVPLVVLTWLAAGLAAWMLYARWTHREASRRRVLAPDQVSDLDGSDGQGVELDETGRGLARWLFLAGYRHRSAVPVFVTATLALGGLGVAAALALESSGQVDRLVDAARSVPGGLGDFAAVVLHAAPWIVLVYGICLPAILVRARRKRRVRDVEQDLPITLELLATMSESGMAFDGALTKALEAQKGDRPLARELTTFQLENLAGIPRVASFRRLARRLEVTSVSIFVSALVQAEQVGAGFASVLRTQADDLRGRRRERANMLAQALPVKLIFPLVLCFLPGIFVTTLGPTFLQFLRLAESMTGR
jgi:tight adherence protein C